jgi:hypothetical protein
VGFPSPGSPFGELERPVEVQYPGVGQTIRADRQNTKLIASFARLGTKLSPIRMTADPSAIAEEITERVTEELDYRIDAANQTDRGGLGGVQRICVSRWTLRRGRRRPPRQCRR